MLFFIFIFTLFSLLLYLLKLIEMKYTKYLIEGNYVDMESIQTENKIFKAPVILASVVIAVAGVATISSMLPFALVVDELRNTRARMIHFKRSGYKL